MHIILGSSSVWRQKVLSEMGYTFTIKHPGVDERSIGDRRWGGAVELTLQLALAKQQALLPSVDKDSILLTSDQVVTYAGTIREKPSCKKQARQWFRSYGQHPHLSCSTITTVCGYNTRTMRGASITDEAHVWLKPLSEEVIERLIGDLTVFSCAGGIAVGYPLFDRYVRKIDGDVSSVMGLPGELTKALIRSLEA